VLLLMMIWEFSPLWIAFFVMDVVLIILLRILLVKKDDATKEKVLMIIAIANFAFWVLYKILLSMRPDFEFVFLKELPLHLCNLNSILIIVAIRTKKDFLLTFCYCLGTIGALFSVLTPDQNFVHTSILTAFGCYWLYHHILLVQAISLVSTGFYRPKYKDIPKAAALLVILYFVMHLFNMILRSATHIDVNYLYTYGMEGNPITEALYRLIPLHPFFFLPVVIPLAGVMFLMVWLARLGKKDSPAKA